MADVEFLRSETVQCQSNALSKPMLRSRNEPTSGVSYKKPANKCLQNNLIYVMYLPKWLEDEKIIKDQNHFGRYGKVTSIIYASKPKDSPLQAYITYSNQKEAAIAIVAVNGIGHSSGVIRTTYGTNRMCKSFYRGEKCHVRNCFYLHDEKRCINIQGPLKTDFQKQKGIAEDIVRNNIVFFMAQIEEWKLNLDQRQPTTTNETMHFPSIEQAINSLIQRNIISKTVYRQALQQQLSSKKKMSQSVKKIQYRRYTQKYQSNKSSSSPSNAQLNTISSKQYSPNTSNLHDETTRTKNQLLMQPILISLNQMTQLPKVQQKRNIESPLLKEFQIVGQQHLSIYWQLLSDKEDCKSDQLQTEESQSEHELPDSFSISQSSPPKRKYSSPDFPRDDCNILARLKQQILRNRLIKKSRLQFAETTPGLEKGQQYQKVTILLRSSLIQ